MPIAQNEAWTLFVKDPFNKLIREKFIEFISPDETIEGRKNKMKPPYSIFWLSITTNVGPVEAKARKIDVRHVNGYLIIPGIVYLLGTKLQKFELNDRLGENQEIRLINYITRFAATGVQVIPLPAVLAEVADVFPHREPADHGRRWEQLKIGMAAQDGCSKYYLFYCTIVCIGQNITLMTYS